MHVWRPWLLLVAVCLMLSAHLRAQQSHDTQSCSVDVNMQQLIVQSVDRLDFETMVRPALFDIEHANASSLVTYRVPFRTVWKLTGLSQIFPNPLPPCCDGLSSTQDCANDFVFTKLSPDSQNAKFVWTMKGSMPLKLSNKLGTIAFSLTLPVKMEGTALIGPDFVTLIFADNLVNLNAVDSNYISAPGKPTTVFDGPIRCTATTGQWSVVRQVNSTNSIPHVDLLVKPMAP